jgi:uncharacterized membrane protein YdjX (TVP38/TMEM64 family)
LLNVGAAAFPFSILSLDIVAVFGFEVIFLANLLAASLREFVIVRVARLGHWLYLQHTVWG